MTGRSRCLSFSLIVFLSVGIFAFAGCLQAAESEQATLQSQKAIVEGAKQMLDGNKMIMETMAKKGLKDAELTSVEKMMTDGYDMVVKGEGMMTGSSMDEGKAMVTRGANMMMKAQKATLAALDKKGMETECSGALDMCTVGEKKVKQNFQTYGLHGDWEPGGM
jgi:hypothetical protein